MYWDPTASMQRFQPESFLDVGPGFVESEEEIQKLLMKALGELDELDESILDEPGIKELLLAAKQANQDAEKAKQAAEKATKAAKNKTDRLKAALQEVKDRRTRHPRSSSRPKQESKQSSQGNIRAAKRKESDDEAGEVLEDDVREPKKMKPADKDLFLQAQNILLCGRDPAGIQYYPVVDSETIEGKVARALKDRDGDALKHVLHTARSDHGEEALLAILDEQAFEMYSGSRAAASSMLGASFSQTYTTPLYFALAYWNFINISSAHVLLNFGSNPNLTMPFFDIGPSEETAFGSALLGMASKSRLWRSGYNLMRLILCHGADPTLVDERGRTALHILAMDCETCVHTQRIKKSHYKQRKSAQLLIMWETILSGGKLSATDGQGKQPGEHCECIKELGREYDALKDKPKPNPPAAEWKPGQRRDPKVVDCKITFEDTYLDPGRPIRISWEA
ncbi:hypothetical protein BT63DRAFT_425511 [Microthyrium microscopicum]|uniref:Uncharacterized protein n=1 Tax=Microthyrium microscopicum TaxID=703497 RepID=A0A6A6U7Q9_9PEZI|nr:hypothetical protein BT63DRAFT_425511 [Microthyrium microscopicum]